MLITSLAIAVIAFIAGYLFSRLLKSQRANRGKGFTALDSGHYLRKIEELRTVSMPLGAIIGYSELLQNELKDNRARKKVSVIRNESRKMLRFLDEILRTHSRSPDRFKLQTEPIRLRSFCLTILEGMVYSAKAKSISLKLNIDEQVPDLVELDGFLLSLILTNLVTSAMQYADSGYLRLGIRRAKKKKNEWTFSVESSDNSIKSDQDRQSFDHYKAMNDNPRGIPGSFGSGAAAAREMVGLIGGELIIENKSRISMRFTLPMRVAENAAIDPAPGDNLEFPGLANSPLLLVESHSVHRELFLHYLQDSNAAIDWTDNGKDAVHRCTTQSYDCILMDSHLPDMPEIIRKIKAEKKHGDTPVIALSSDIDDVARLPQENGLWFGCLKKSVRRNEFLAKIDAAVSRKKQSDPLSMRNIADTMGGDMGQAIAILDRFLEDSDELLEELHGLLESNNWKDSHRLVHSLKTGAESLFAGSLAESAREFEDILKEYMDDPVGKTTDDRVLIYEVLQSLLDSFEEVQNYCEQNILRDETQGR